MKPSLSSECCAVHGAPASRRVEHLHQEPDRARPKRCGPGLLAKRPGPLGLAFSKRRHAERRLAQQGDRRGHRARPGAR